MNGPAEREAMFELVASFALGTLPEHDRARVTAFLAADAEARREFDDLRAAADSIGLAAEEPVDTARSARMKANLLALVRGTGAVRPTVRPLRPNNVIWMTALAAAAALVFAFGSVLQNAGLRSDLHDSAQREAALQAQVTAERAEVQRDARILADLTASDAKRYDVAYGTVVTRGSHLYLAFHGLPALPRGRVYQAWTLPKGASAVVPGITFAPTGSGTTIVPLTEDASHLAAVAVSVEPTGGSRAPTTKPAFVQPLT